MPSAIVKFIDGIVAHQIVVVEYYGIQTETCGQGEFLIRGPFVLGIHANLAEAHACGRILLPVIAVGDGHCLRNPFIQEVIKAAVAVVS